MVADPERAIVTPQYVADFVDAYMRGGMKPEQAAARIIATVRADGLQDEFIDALGPRAVIDLWTRLRSSTTPTPIKRQEPTPQQPRRIDVEKLKESASLLEGMYQIGGQWVRVGDMDKSACRAAAQQYRATALENAHQSRYFHELAKTLNGGERVRQRFDNAELLRLWDVAGRDS